jgi:hypothetical protein
MFQEEIPKAPSSNPKQKMHWENMSKEYIYLRSENLI